MYCVSARVPASAKGREMSIQIKLAALLAEVLRALLDGKGDQRREEWIPSILV
jgi:hypothetical protein